LRDDFQLPEVDLKPLVNVASNLLFRAPRSTIALRANSAQQAYNSKLLFRLNYFIYEERNDKLLATDIRQFSRLVALTGEFEAFVIVNDPRFEIQH